MTDCRKALIFFITPAESGAPGYLSRRGEDAASNAAETLAQFLQETLQIPLEIDWEARRDSLEQDHRWKSTEINSHWSQGAIAAHEFYRDVLLLSGTKSPSQLTLKPLAETLALPIILCDLCDLSPADVEQGRPGLAEFFHEWAHREVPWPRALVIACSAPGLFQWITAEVAVAQGRQKDAELLKEGLKLSSQEWIGPSVLSVGWERSEKTGSTSFLVESPEKPGEELTTLTIS